MLISCRTVRQVRRFRLAILIMKFGLSFRKMVYLDLLNDAGLRTKDGGRRTLKSSSFEAQEKEK